MTRPSHRIVGIDVARAVATLLMIQTHAYDGWVRESERATLAYRITRVLGTLPLPMFLLLAGLSLGIRVRRAIDAGESMAELRGALSQNALGVIAWGYGLSFAYALLDGARGIETLLRFDVLHVIGLSLLVLAWSGLALHGPSVRARFVSSAIVWTLIPLLICPLVTPLGHVLTGPLRFLLAPLIEVPGITRMPLVPLVAFAGLGAWAGFYLGAASTAFPRGLGQLALWAALATLVGTLGSAWALAAGMTISRENPTIWLNALDLCGRASLAIVCSTVLATRLGATRSLWVALGQQSMFVYALHLPFCYGRAARAIKRALDMPQASCVLVLLITFCVALVALRSSLSRRSKNQWRALS